MEIYEYNIYTGSDRNLMANMLKHYFHVQK